MNDTERANRVLEKVARDPKIQQVIADARMFDALRTDPGWRRLFDVVAAQKGKWMSKLANRMMYGTKPPTPEEIAYHRGFFEGAYFVLIHPEVAEDNLERAAQVAWTLYGEPDDTEEVLT